MRVTVNGEQREISADRVDALLGELEYEGTHFAIALNFDVLHAAAGRVRMVRHDHASSPRRRGPITPGVDCCRRPLPHCRNAITRRMGPRLRGDDALKGGRGPC